MQYLVLDIETIRDERVWQPPDPSKPWGFAAGSDVPGGSGLRGVVTPPTPDHFAPPHGWRPIVIGCVLFERDPKTNVIVVKRVGSIESEGPDPDQRERALLEQFSLFVRDRGLTVVTWNGRRFDLPVLLLRSLRYGIGHSWYYGDLENRKRYTEVGHCDLMDHMSENGATERLNLDGMAKLIGLPGKFGSIDGKGVAEAFAAGRDPEISAYCVSDAVQTAFLWLRWLVLKELIPIQSYQQTARDLLRACEANGQLTEFLGLVDRRVLLLEQAALKEAA